MTKTSHSQLTALAPNELEAITGGNAKADCFVGGAVGAAVGTSFSFPVGTALGAAGGCLMGALLLGKP